MISYQCKLHSLSRRDRIIDRIDEWLGNRSFKYWDSKLSHRWNIYTLKRMENGYE